jgi:hypothetical protein
MSDSLPEPNKNWREIAVDEFDRISRRTGLWAFFVLCAYGHITIMATGMADPSYLPTRAASIGVGVFGAIVLTPMFIWSVFGEGGDE